MEAVNTSPRHENGNEKTQHILAVHPWLIPTGGSDSHREEDVGRGGIETEQPLQSEGQLIDLLRSRNYRIIDDACVSAASVRLTAFLKAAIASFPRGKSYGGSSRSASLYSTSIHPGSFGTNGADTREGRLAVRRQGRDPVRVGHARHREAASSEHGHLQSTNVGDVPKRIPEQ